MDDMLSFYYVEGSRSCSPQPQNLRGGPQLVSYGWSLGQENQTFDDGISWDPSYPATALTHNLSQGHASPSSEYCVDTRNLYDDTFLFEVEPRGPYARSSDFDSVGDLACPYPLPDTSRHDDDRSDTNPVQMKYSFPTSNPSVVSIDETFTQPLSLWTCSMGFNTRLPISGLDKYLVALRQIVRRCAEATTLSAHLCRTLSAEGVLWVVRESWPTAEGFWNLTTCIQGFLYAELWRNFPCEDSYKSLPAAYRPTQMQLLVPHSPIIDWLPWPDLRDMIILYQDQIDIDALCRYAILTMVAHRRKRTGTKELDGASSSSATLADTHAHVLDLDATQEEAEANGTEGYGDGGITSFRIWDLTRLETLDGSTQLTADRSLQAAPRPRSPSMKALQRAYNLVYDDFSTQKLEDRFFERYPFLYCQRLVSEFKIQDLATVPFEDVGSPVDMTRDTVFRLKANIERIIGVTVEI